MAFHTFDVDRADALDDPSRYRFCSREELLTLLALSPTDVVADLGSGTGFYTDDVAPFVDTLYAIDVQREMHDRYRQRDVPETVEFVTAGVSDLPFADDALDAAFSTMTYHEFATDESLAELARVVRPGGRVVTVDWSARGDGGDGPTTAERYDLGHAVSSFADAGFVTTHAVERRETFVSVVRRES
jgi:ubiquinone/menaquinone biosynthesis C-methylase UbiE